MRRESDYSTLLPRTVALLGELGPCALRDPRTGDFYGMDYVPGRLLCCDEEGREMFVLKPFRDGGRPRLDAQAVRVMDLYERFQHRRGDGFYNAFCPPFRKPRPAGEMAVITYVTDKDEGEAEYVHYFEGDGEPAYALFYNLGNDQFYFPRGRWCVASAGIEYADE